MPPFSVAQIANEPKAVLLILHGLAEYADRYRSVAELLAARGISTFAFDQRGHGGQRPKTHIDRFDGFVDDALMQCGQLRAAHPKLPLFVWGHSMGTIVALLLAMRSPESLRGLILTSNSLDLFRYRKLSPLAPPLRALARIAPRTRIPLMLASAMITSDKNAQRAHASDTLIAKTASLQLLIEFALACNRADEGASKLQLPALVTHGADDQIAPSSGSQRLFDRIGSTDKQLHVFPGLRHELQQEREPDRSQFIDLLGNWILERSR